MNDLDINNGGGGGGDDDEDFCRGYGAQTNEGFDEGFQDGDNEQDCEYNDSQPYIDEAEIVDKAPEMPQHFYKDVENFLTMAPPKLNDKGLKKGVKGSTGVGKVPLAGGIQLPDINLNRQVAGESGPPRPPAVTSKVRSKLQANTGKVKSQPQFDHTLLREAFAYTDKLLKEAIMEEAAAGAVEESASSRGNLKVDPSRPPLKGSSKKVTGKSGSAMGSGLSQGKPAAKTTTLESVYMAPPTDFQANSRKKSDSAGRERKSVVKRMRAKIPSEAAMYTANNDSDGAFNIIGDAEADQGRRNPINFDELVSNFEGGFTLQKLRKELEQSKQSMKKSENFMKQLSMEYLGSGRL